MKKILLILLLFFSCEVYLNGMVAPETAQAQRPSTLPKILHKIAYSERVGKFCAWLTSPIAKCCKSKRLQWWFGSPQQTSPELGDHPLVKLTKVTPSTSRSVACVKKSVAILSIGFLLLINLPQAEAVFDNLQDYLKPTVCVQNDNFKRCCTIEDNMHISCCVTDNILGIEVCKDYLVTMPETASVPFGDLSRLKDQCSADLTSEARMIRPEFDGIMQEVEQGEVPTIAIPANVASGSPNFLKKFQESLESIGIPLDAPIYVAFPKSSESDTILAAAMYANVERIDYLYNRYPSSGLATMHLRSNLLEYFSVDEIFASINHELGHLLFKIRKLADSQFGMWTPLNPATFDFNEEMFADLVSSLSSKKDVDQTSFLRQHVALRETNSHLKEDDHLPCLVNCMWAHPPLLCRIAYSDSIQNQLPA